VGGNRVERDHGAEVSPSWVMRHARPCLVQQHQRSLTVNGNLQG
jgi:hypothetical protein